MKKLIYTLFFVLISVVANGQAKYVFYFIGDGMGVNQVNGTEMYQAEIQNGRIGVEPLLFTQFPVATMAMIKRRISQRSATNPAALACTMQLPIAVASEGPATTGMFITFAVN